MKKCFMSWNHPSYMVLLEGANSLWCKRNTFKTFTPVLIARFSQSVTHPPECHSSKRRLVRDHNLIPPAPPPLLCVGAKSWLKVAGNWHWIWWQKWQSLIVAPICHIICSQVSPISEPLLDAIHQYEWEDECLSSKRRLWRDHNDRIPPPSSLCDSLLVVLWSVRERDRGESACAELLWRLHCRNFWRESTDIQAFTGVFSRSKKKKEKKACQVHAECLQFIAISLVFVVVFVLC